MFRAGGMSVRLKLALSYAGFLLVSSGLLLFAVWAFLLRGVRFQNMIPPLSDWGRVFDLSNRGPIIFGPAVILATGFLLAFGLIGGWLLAGRMLAPLGRLTDATRLAATGSLSHRVGLEGGKDEFRELADSFDAMLARLEAQVAEQQRFAANASHELRTPLATTKALLELALSDPTVDLGKLVERLHAVNGRAIALTEALLLLSRADQRSFTSEAIDVSLLIEEAAESLLPIAEKRGLIIDASGEIALVVGSKPLLLQMTTNLLHNAVVHNLPEGGVVWITARRSEQAVLMTVENTGEPLTPELVATLTEPFQRGANRIRNDHAGVGLGLAIVKSIIQAHDGTLALSARPEGGLRVTASLPAAPDS